ncbi:MAG TPA: PAS domain S-box protein [Bacteroidales bacterium]|nr:PAS domain S-box protein [Bacteroidales bacterium]
MKSSSKNKPESQNDDQRILDDLKAANKSLQKELDECRKTNSLHARQIEELSTQLDRIRNGYSRSEDAITIIDITEGENYLKICDMNPMAQNCFNISQEKIDNGLFLKEIISEANYRVFIEEKLPYIKQGKLVFSADDIDSANEHWNVKTFPMYDRSGAISHAVTIRRNVTMEYKNRKLSAMLQAAIDSLPFEIWIRDANGIEVYQNKASRASEGDLIGTRIYDINIPENKIEQGTILIDKVLAGEFITTETSFEQNGKVRWINMILDPVKTDNETIGYAAIMADISDRKNTENELRNSEERFRLIARQSKNLLYDYNLLTGHIEWDGAIEEVTGFTPLEYKTVRYDDWVRMIHPDDMEDTASQFEKAVKENQSFRGQYRYRRKDGDYIWIEENSKTLEFSDGKPSRIIGVMIDITERKNADEIIYKSQKLLSDTQRIAHIGSWEYYYRDDMLLWNEEAYKILGLERPEHAPAIEDFIHLVHPDDRQIIIDHFEKTVREKDFKDIEYRIIRPDGEIRSLLTVGALDFDEKGNAYRSFGIIQDLTKRKKDEELIKRSKERYDLVTNLSGYVVFDHDLRMGKVKWAGAIKELTGYSPEELSALSPVEVNKLHHPDDRNLIMTQLGLLTNNFSRKLQYRFYKKDQGYIWVEANAFLFTDKIGKPVRWLGIMRDVTEQKRVNELVKESEEKLRKIFNTSKDGILLINKDMEFMEVNDTALKKTGYTHEEIIGKSITTLLSDEGVRYVKQYIASQGDPDTFITIEENAKRKDGSVFPVEFNATSIHLRDQDAFLLMARDISERKHMERELLNSVISTEERERLYFSQELHDGLGPLLSAAKLYVEWLADPTPIVDQGTIILDIWKILEEANKSIRDISFKLSPHTLQNYGLGEALKGYAGKVEQTAKAKININNSISVRIENTIETILYRVMCECINNTIKHAEAKNINITLDLAGDMLYASYSDDGKGFNIDETIESRKGIGLLNMQSRVKAVNGTLSIDSASGKGTKVDIKIPVRV